MSEVCWDYGPGEVDTGLVKLEPNSLRIAREQNECLADTSLHNQFNVVGRTQDPEPNKSPNGSSTGQSGTCIVDQEKSPVDDSTPCSTSPISSMPVCRQFWKAGAYDEEAVSANTHGSSLTSAGSRINIHPKFLHSNATSHKWAFGAIAELLDNAVDEIQNGATYVYIDKTINPRNGSPALLFQDDGAGMDPEGMRQCLSFGFSDKKLISAIGKYGNGFKTSTMRLGADVIVFSRYFVESTWTYTQSIGLLSYTFLTQSGYDRIVVPMVHYKFNFTKGCFESLQPKSNEQSNSNLSVLLQWSPYSTEEELLKQFEHLGSHGTKVIIYNLWLNDEGKMELDFDSDPEDIRIGWDGSSKAKNNSRKAINEDHLANKLQYSLRAYLSILYLKLPDTFCMILRERVVLYHNIATELKHPEFIIYRARSDGRREGEVVTTIGFLKEAPVVNIHGFNIYHKRRLILPFLQVAPYSHNRGRGVVGVLEANFIEPTHNKQDFEKTNVFQKLVTRLKDMTYEYWDYHCGLIGYQPPKKALSVSASPGLASPTPPPPLPPSRKTDVGGGSKSLPTVTQTNKTAVTQTIYEPVELVSRSTKGSSEGPSLKRKIPDQPEDSPSNKQKTARSAGNTGSSMHDNAHNQMWTNVMQENKKRKMQCLAFEKAEEELNIKVMQLKSELREAQREYADLLSKIGCLEQVKGEN
uniref:protein MICRORCHIDIA 6-like n=1 Tax=Erigeron canadensis TaxID=72917 RepID=UPI001CB99680|nr:protein MICRORCHIDIA 6-like [Erigeron canadensis]XP_043637701.1 protein MICRORCHIDIA 6-like [Erigeron canadensis]